MPVPVYFMDARSIGTSTSSIEKIKTLLHKLAHANPAALLPGELCAVKIHFGELGNDSYISPVFAKAAADQAKAAGAKPFFTDTNTLYKGSRSNSVDHLATAAAHGFVPEVCGAPVVIADGLKSSDWREVPMPAACTQFKSTKIAGGILDADSMIVLTHVKAHEMAGFGGAIKNLAMGCAPFMGKREQHCVTFNVKEKKCVSCGRCVTNCPVNAIHFTSQDKANIDPAKCIGCGECLAHCAPHAIGMDWDVGLPEFTRKMTEYALGAVLAKKGKVLYLNIVRNVVPACDCVPWSDVPIVPDIGFLASADPVAIDQASFDLVKASPVWPGSVLDGKASKGDDKFTILYPESLSEMQMEYGEKIGLGSRAYELFKL